MSTVSQLYDDIKDGDIDLEPDYQRDGECCRRRRLPSSSSMLTSIRSRLPPRL